MLGEKDPATKIAILGWGSLLWDPRPAFDEQHGPWAFDGPSLKLEFSRRSQSRLGALTLVIDPKHGQACEVAYSLSTRSNADEAIRDLRCREGVAVEGIGYFYAEGPRRHGRDVASLVAISAWAIERQLDVVIWTDLDGHFHNVSKRDFVRTAVRHIQGLTPEGKAKAAEYVWRAPDFVQTSVRTALQKKPWFTS